MWLTPALRATSRRLSAPIPDSSMSARLACRAGSCRSRITEFSVKKPLTVSPYGLAWGPDGAVWFTALEGFIGRLTPTGDVLQFDLLPSSEPMSNAPTSITAGPDGNLWFTYYAAPGLVPTIGRMTPQGQLTEFPLPHAASQPMPPLGDIISGADGNLWFAEPADGLIGRFDPH